MRREEFFNTLLLTLYSLRLLFGTAPPLKNQENLVKMFIITNFSHNDKLESTALFIWFISLTQNL